jgi:hypothetical protein
MAGPPGDFSRDPAVIHCCWRYVRGILMVPFQPGDHGQVNTGPFAGMTGTVVAAADPTVLATLRSWRNLGLPAPPHDTIWVQVDVMGALLPAAFIAEELEPA